MALANDDNGSLDNTPALRWLRRHLRIPTPRNGERFFSRKHGLRYAATLLLVLILVALSDVIFAVDSIPIIFAVTINAFMVLTFNLFTIFGLRAVYFLLAGVAGRFSRLNLGCRPLWCLSA